MNRAMKAIEMKKLILVIVAALSVGTGWGQKMVIGSKVPEWQDQVTWLSSAPDGGRPLLIDFYDPGNPSSKRFWPKYEEIRAKYGSAVEMVIVVQQGVDVDSLSFDEGVPFAIAYDDRGTMYEQFNVQYLPYSVLVTSGGELFWQGNLGNLSNETLDKIR